MSPILSICIPTFNRVTELEYLLESISNQNVPEIEIVISDNCSTDNTEQLVNSFMERFSSVVYSKWDRNEGPDRNFLKVVELASGKYCWLLGSDDAITNSAIDKLLSICEEDFDIGLLNLVEANCNMRPIGKHEWLYGINGDQSFNLRNKAELLNFFDRAQPLLGLFMGYISSIVVRKSAWDSISGKEQWIGSFFSFTYVVISLINEGCVLKYIKEPLVINRGHNDSIVEGGSKAALTKRILLDIDAYLRLSGVFCDKDVKKAFLRVGVRNYTWFPLLKLRLFAGRKEWDKLCGSRLAQLGIANKTIAIVNLIGIFSGFISGLYWCKQRFLPKARILSRKFY